MLPDYPEVKERIEKILNKRMNRIVKGALFEDTSRQRVFEGTLTVIRRPDGTVDEVPYKLFRAGFEISLTDVQNMTPDEIIQKMDSIATDMAKQSAEYNFETINAAIEKIGNTVHSQEFNADVLLDALEKITVDFYPNGKPIMPSIYVHPSKASIFKQVIDSLENSPELKRRQEEILSRKKEEWRVRESNRKLVG